MTYTFKLARRLAVLRGAGGFAVAVWLASCTSGDSGSIAEPGTPSSLVDIAVAPDRVTLARNQVTRFTAFGVVETGDTVPVVVDWYGTGGSVGNDGSFSSASVGAFHVIGRHRQQGGLSDTALVTVVDVQPTPMTIELSPRTVTLSAGASQEFTVVGRLADGSTTPIHVTWTGSGGSITAAGIYTAGQQPGQYEVIATMSGGQLADTARVTIAVQTPTLQAIVLNPANATVRSGAQQQFTAAGLRSDGSTVSVPVVFTAQGGTITATGLYTAGVTPGTFRVVARHGSLPMADTAVVTITASTPPPSGTACTNEPGGLTPISDQPWDARPPARPATDTHGWTTNAGVANLQVVTDPTAPKSGGNVMAGRFPAGHPGGSGPFRMDLDFGRNYSQVYVCVWTKLSPNFTNNGNAMTKWGFFLTPYVTAPQQVNHFFNLTDRLGINLQSSGAVLNRNLWSTFNLMNSKGVWHKVEFLVIGNSMGASDGVARMWVDGVQVLNATDVKYFYDGQSPAFSGITWNPTYGGGTNPVPYDMYQYIDHWYVSGR